jgi:hypothetical protein
MARTKEEGDDQLITMNVRVPSSRLPAGHAPLIDNVLPKPGAIGDVRAGFQGQLSLAAVVALGGGPVYSPMAEAVRMPDGTASRVLLTTPGGKLHYNIVGATTTTNVQRSGPGVTLGDFAMADGGEHCQIVQDGKWLYGIEGGSAGRPFRIDTTGAPWVAELLTSIGIPEFNSENSGVPYLLLHPTRQCKLAGTYRYRVQAITSSTAAYPPTGGSARESQPSAPSLPLSIPVLTAAVRGSKVNAIGVPVLPPPSGTSGLTHYVIERQGGDFASEGALALQWRVVAVVPIGANDATGTLATPANGGYVWDATTAPPLSIFYDMVPDTDLVDAEVVTTGEALPVGADAIGTHAGRLWAGIQNAAYYSRLLTSDFANIRDGLFWDTAVDPTDPLLPVLGGTLTLGADGSNQDRIKAFASVPTPEAQEKFGTILHIFKESSITPVIGSSGADFQALAAIRAVGRGLAARRALAYTDGGQWAYLGADGPLIYDARQPAFAAEDLASLVTADGIASVTGFARAAFLYHRRRLWAIFPQAGEVYPSVVYVWQGITRGWSRVSQSVVTGFTSGAIAASSRDTEQLYLHGRDGQLYQWTGTVDRAAPGGSDVAIASEVIFRDHAISTFNYQSPGPLSINMDSGAPGQVLSWEILTEKGVKTDGVWNLSEGEDAGEITSVSSVLGSSHHLRLTASTTSTLTMLAYAIRLIEQGRKR